VPSGIGQRTVEKYDPGAGVMGLACWALHACADMMGFAVLAMTNQFH
jgi:hypothetical protein